MGQKQNSAAFEISPLGCDPGRALQLVIDMNKISKNGSKRKEEKLKETTVTNSSYKTGPPGHFHSVRMMTRQKDFMTSRNL